jgi:type IV secretion system protein TrbL
MKCSKLCTTGIIVVTFVLIPKLALALDLSTIEQMTAAFQQRAHNWESSLTGVAAKLFWILAGIEFTWTAVQLALKKAEEEEWLSALVGRVMYIGFFWALLMHSADWCRAIIESFREAGGVASGLHALHPEAVIGIGLESVVQIWNFAKDQNPFTAAGVLAAGIIIMGCFGLMAAFLIEALIESYIVISAGIIFMGFGGSSWTSDYAKTTLRYAVSSGAKLFILQLLMGVGLDFMQSLTITAPNGPAPPAFGLPQLLPDKSNLGEHVDAILVMMGVAIAMCAVTWNIPNKVQALVNNASFAHSEVVRSVVMSRMTSLIQRLERGGLLQGSKAQAKDSSESERQKQISQNTRAILDSMPNYKRTSTPS